MTTDKEMLKKKRFVGLVIVPGANNEDLLRTCYMLIYLSH